MVQFEVGKHYDGAICLARRGKKETWVYMPLHKEGQPIPEYWPRGKSGVYADWYRVRVVNGIECAGPDWMEFRADNWLTDSERARELLDELNSKDCNLTKDKPKRKSKKQIEREEFEESCRMAREFYAGLFKSARRGLCAVARMYAELFKWLFSRKRYSRKS